MLKMKFQDKAVQKPQPTFRQTHTLTYRHDGNIYLSTHAESEEISVSVDVAKVKPLTLCVQERIQELRRERHEK